MSNDVHSTKPVVYTKEAFSGAKRAILCVNGFDGTAVGILRFITGLNISGLLPAAIEADDLIWFHKPLTEERKVNEPHLSYALDRIEKAVEEIRSLGFSQENIYFLGFSQGACLLLDFALKKQFRWGGVFALAGCLIGSDDEVERVRSDLKGTPVFIGYGDTDVAISSERVHRSVEILKREGANVDFKVYPYTGHRINRQEAEYIKNFLN
ncbi:MAG: alpha/beta hydrolase [Patescibacteria group bacterium]